MQGLPETVDMLKVVASIISSSVFRGWGATECRPALGKGRLGGGGAGVDVSTVTTVALHNRTESAHRKWRALFGCFPIRSGLPWQGNLIRCWPSGFYSGFALLLVQSHSM
jgi:hypothetical protein